MKLLTNTTDCVFPHFNFTVIKTTIQLFRNPEISSCLKPFLLNIAYAPQGPNVYICALSRIG